MDSIPVIDLQPQCLGFGLLHKEVEGRIEGGVECLALVVLHVNKTRLIISFHAHPGVKRLTVIAPSMHKTLKSFEVLSLHFNRAQEAQRE